MRKIDDASQNSNTLPADHRAYYENFPTFTTLTPPIDDESKRFFVVHNISGMAADSTVRLPVLIKPPEDSYIVRNRPARLTCRAVYADRIIFKCDGEWVRQEEHEIGRGVDAGSLIPYLESIVNIHKLNVGAHGVSCECYAYTTTAGSGTSSSGGNFGVKSEKVTVKVATLSKHFLQEPASERQPVSSMVQLRCTPPDGEPRPEIYWSKDGREIEARVDPNVIIANDGSLIIAAARVTDSGSYTCGARNAANQRLSQTANVTIYVNGEWSEWGKWDGECPEDCEDLARFLTPLPKPRRHRKCNQPPPQNGGRHCEGLAEQDMDCALPCPIDGQWSAWTEWTRCERVATSVHSSGEENPKNIATDQQACHRKRERFCDSPTPKNSGAECLGAKFEFQNCTTNDLCTDAGSRLASLDMKESNAKVGQPSTPTDINLAMYTGLGAGAVVFVLAFLFLLALFMRRRASSCHRCGVNNHYKEYEAVAVGANGSCARPAQVIIQNGGAFISSGKGGGIGAKGKTCSYSVCPLPPDLTHNAPLLIYDSAHPPSSLKSDQSRLGLLASGWSGHNSDSSGDRSHCTTTDDNYATVDDPCCGAPSLSGEDIERQNQRNALFANLFSPNTPAAWTHIGPEGGCLQLPDYGVSLLVPPGAVGPDRTVEIFVAVRLEDSPKITCTSSSSSAHTAILSPVVWCGPSDLALRKPVVLTFDHCAHMMPTTSASGGWRLSVYECEQSVAEERQNGSIRDSSPSLNSKSTDLWKPAAVIGRETLNTSVYCQMDPDCAHLLLDTLSRFVLVGEYDSPSTTNSPSVHCHPTKRCRLLAFVSASDCSLRIYCVADTKAAVRRALTAERETGAGGRLACEPQLFHLTPNADLCLCMEEVTPAWRRRQGANYQEIPASHLWPASSSTVGAPLHCSFALENAPAAQDDQSLERRHWRSDADQQQHMLIQARVIVYQKGDANSSRCVLMIDTSADWPAYVCGLERRMLTIKLTSELRYHISQLLDQPNERENDWRMFARQLAVDHYLPYFAARPSPTELILLLWEARERGPRAAVQLMQLFYAMQRQDAAELVALYLEEI